MNNTVTYNEQELVLSLKARDQQSFSYLYDNYAGALYSIVLQVVPDKELASDVLQDVFVNIWRKIESYDPTKGRLFTWMLNVARNLAIDMVRSKAYQNSQKNRPCGVPVYPYPVTHNTTEIFQNFNYSATARGTGSGCRSGN